MGKKSHIMSLSLDPDTQEKLKLYARQKTNNNVSKLIRDLVDKYLVCEDDVIPVILKIPVDLKGDSDSLEKWLKARSSAIVKALSS